jgi:hypothetical protein
MFPGGWSRGRISRQPDAREKNGQTSIWDLEGRPVGVRENMIDGTKPWVVSEEQTARKRRFVVLRSPVSQDGEGVTWNWGLCRERFDGTHTMLLRPLALMVHGVSSPGGQCEQLLLPLLLAAASERSRQNDDVHEECW